MVKPKLHYLHHVLDSLKRHGKLLNCFVNERKTQRGKTRRTSGFLKPIKACIGIGHQKTIQTFQMPWYIPTYMLAPTHLECIRSCSYTRYVPGSISNWFRYQSDAYTDGRIPCLFVGVVYRLCWFIWCWWNADVLAMWFDICCPRSKACNQVKRLRPCHMHFGGYAHFDCKCTLAMYSCMR